MSVTHLRNNRIWKKKSTLFYILKNIIYLLQKHFQVVLTLLMGKEFSYNYVCKYLSKVFFFNLISYLSKLN